MVRLDPDFLSERLTALPVDVTDFCRSPAADDAVREVTSLLNFMEEYFMLDLNRGHVEEIHIVEGSIACGRLQDRVSQGDNLIQLRLRGIKPFARRNGPMLLKLLEAIENDELAHASDEPTGCENSSSRAECFNSATRRDFHLQCQYGCRRCRPNVNSKCKKPYRCLER